MVVEDGYWINMTDKERRPSKKNSMKENKKYPYKNKINKNGNEKRTRRKSAIDNK